MALRDSADQAKTVVSVPLGVLWSFVMASARGCARGVRAAHGAAALAASLRTDAGLAFLFLLVGFALGFFALGFGEIALLLRLAVVFRGSRFMQRDGDGLAAILHFAALAPPPALQVAMRAFMRDTAGRLPLPR